MRTRGSPRVHKDFRMREVSKEPANSTERQKGSMEIFDSSTLDPDSAQLTSNPRPVEPFH